MKGRARAVGEMLQGLINFSVNGSVQFSRSVMSDCGRRGVTNIYHFNHFEAVVQEC